MAENVYGYPISKVFKPQEISGLTNNSQLKIVFGIYIGYYLCIHNMWVYNHCDDGTNALTLKFFDGKEYIPIINNENFGSDNYEQVIPKVAPVIYGVNVDTATPSTIPGIYGGYSRERHSVEGVASGTADCMSILITYSLLQLSKLDKPLSEIYKGDPLTAGHPASIAISEQTVGGTTSKISYTGDTIVSSTEGGVTTQESIQGAAPATAPVVTPTTTSTPSAPTIAPGPTGGISVNPSKGGRMDREQLAKIREQRKRLRERRENGDEYTGG